MSVTLLLLSIPAASGILLLKGVRLALPRVTGFSERTFVPSVNGHFSSSGPWDLQDNSRDVPPRMGNTSPQTGQPPELGRDAGTSPQGQHSSAFRTVDYGIGVSGSGQAGSQPENGGHIRIAGRVGKEGCPAPGKDANKPPEFPADGPPAAECCPATGGALAPPAPTVTPTWPSQ